MLELIQPCMSFDGHPPQRGILLLDYGSNLAMYCLHGKFFFIW